MYVLIFSNGRKKYIRTEYVANLKFSGGWYIILTFEDVLLALTQLANLFKSTKVLKGRGLKQTKYVHPNV